MSVSMDINCFLFRACLRSRILALQTPKFYLAGSKKSRKLGFLRSIDRKNPHLEQALNDFETLDLFGPVEVLSKITEYSEPVAKVG